MGWACQFAKFVTFCGLTQAFGLFSAGQQSCLVRRTAQPFHLRFPAIALAGWSTSRYSRVVVRTNSRGRSGSSSESPVRQERRHAYYGRRHIVITRLGAWDKLGPKHPLLMMLCLKFPGI